jgi:hypothetical protein
LTSALAPPKRNQLNIQSLPSHITHLVRKKADLLCLAALIPVLLRGTVNLCLRLSDHRKHIFGWVGDAIGVTQPLNEWLELCHVVYLELCPICFLDFEFITCLEAKPYTRNNYKTAKTMAKRRLSVSSEDTDDETTMMLRTQGISDARIKNFQARTKRIEARRAVRASPVGEFCSNCSVVTIEAIRVGFRISNSFEGLRVSSENCRLCRLVLMSLRNKLPEIDAKLENHGSTTSAVAVKFHDDGSTDVESSNAFRIDRVPQVTVCEKFELSMGNEADGIIRVKARVTTGHENGRQLFLISSLIRIYTKDGR